MTEHDVVGVSLALNLERWSFCERPGHCVCRADLVGFEKEDVIDLRIFVEHAARLQVAKCGACKKLAMRLRQNSSFSQGSRSTRSISCRWRNYMSQPYLHHLMLGAVTIA